MLFSAMERKTYLLCTDSDVGSPQPGAGENLTFSPAWKRAGNKRVQNGEGCACAQYFWVAGRPQIYTVCMCMLMPWERYTLRD